MAFRRHHGVCAALIGGLSLGGCFQVAGFDDFTFQEPFRGPLEQSTIDKIDLLFVIDNSRGIADKHEIIGETLEAFVGRLVNPRCVSSADGSLGTQPATVDDPCPAGEQREFDAATDMHVGIITTSLGSHGADVCDDVASPTENDRAHLVHRTSPTSGDLVPTYEGRGFLAWDPEGRKSPPGEGDIGQLVDNLTAIVDGVGEEGCGFEAPLEAWYRFLVEPEPHLDVVVDSSLQASLVGVDTTVLEQRAAFVRPDSLVAIVMVTDENDCSIRDGSNFYLAAQLFQPNTNEAYHLPRARPACAIDPNDPCCRSCGQPPGDGCIEEPGECEDMNLSPDEDNVNIRCFDQKRRFGIDFLYPTDRYVTGLTSELIPDSTGQLVDNPLLAGRPAGRVVLAGIVGVPWQDIARTDANGQPNLLTGLDVLGRERGGVKNASELTASVGDYDNTWALILGDPDDGVLPADPLMVESLDPRNGTTHPLTGEPLADVNGGEFANTLRGEVQRACAFEGKDCTNLSDEMCRAGKGQSCAEHTCREGLECRPDMRCAEPCNMGGTNCDCTENDPLCGDEGEDANYRFADSAFPGTRLLSVLRDVGTQGVVGSICPFQVADPSSIDFGFTPALNGAVVERLRGALKEHLCLDRSLLPDETGHVDCVLVEARDQPDGVKCSEACNTKGRSPASDEHRDAVALAKGDPSRGCFCVIEQLESLADLEACENNVAEPFKNGFGQEVNGWCFVDAMTDPPLGDPTLAASCPGDRRRIIRLSGLAQQARGSRLYLYCE